MTELIIDKKSVDLPADFNFNIVVENPYFTDASEYTEEIELNPHSKKNVKIFGSTFRLDYSKRKIVKDCELKVGNKTLIKGNMTTTEFTNNSVKIQLLGGNSSINFLMEWQKMYIDQMDLGTFDVSSWENILDPNNYKKDDGSIDWEGFAKYVMAEPEEREWIMLPSKKKDGTIVNGWDLFFNDNIEYQGYWIKAGKGYPIATAWRNGEYDGNYAIQPRLTAIVERVINALGYRVTAFDAKLFEQRYIYYVNVKDTFALNEMLPHWTVSEFLEEIQNFFACVFVFDTKRMECRINSRGDYFESDIKELKLVEEVFNVDVEEDNKDISGTNLKYAKGEIDIKYLFDDYANEHSKVIHCENEGQIYSALFNNGYDVVAEYEGRYYVRHIIYNDEDIPINEIVEVNHLGCKYNKDESSNMELKIIPADTEKGWLYIIIGNSVYNPYMEERQQMVIGEEPKSNSSFNIDKYINEKEEIIENDLDLLRVAVFTSWQDMDVKTNGYSYWDNYTVEGETKEYGGWSMHGEEKNELIFENIDKIRTTLALRDIEGLNTVYSEGVGKAKFVDQSCPHNFTFYDDFQNEDINKTFLIRGHKYVCEKVTLDVDARGVQKRKKGVFYRIE